MAAPVIAIENLSKSYRLGVIGTGTFYGDVKRWAAKKLGMPDPYKKIDLADHGNREGDTIWALRDISFEVAQGETVGIIGRNGAGKSTLLKILSQVTAPTAGAVKVKGRIASLLEVGTGFHPELTGRENIFMNGTILGMRKHEIQGKLDEIINFSGVEKFIDTPVKRYSSGMYVRLAFAVAAHLEPEILIVDEVLAVGDAEFQKKCLGKMNDASKNQGRTVLFVSHNMAAIQQLCQRGVLLANGKIELLDNDIDKVILQYLNETEKNSTVDQWLAVENAPFANNYFSLNRMAITDAGGTTLQMPIKNDADFYFTVEFDLKQQDPAFQIGFALYDSDNRLLFWSFSTDAEESAWPKLATGRNILRTRLQKHFFNEGSYRVMLLAACYHRAWILKPDEDTPCIHFEINGGLSPSPYWYEKRRGLLAPVLSWQAAAEE